MKQVHQNSKKSENYSIEQRTRSRAADRTSTPVADPNNPVADQPAAEMMSTPADGLLVAEQMSKPVADPMNTPGVDQLVADLASTDRVVAEQLSTPAAVAGTPCWADTQLDWPG
eukprot:192277_1